MVLNLNGKMLLITLRKILLYQPVPNIEFIYLPCYCWRSEYFDCKNRRKKKLCLLVEVDNGRKFMLYQHCWKLLFMLEYTWDCILYYMHTQYIHRIEISFIGETKKRRKKTENRLDDILVIVSNLKNTRERSFPFWYRHCK